MRLRNLVFAVLLCFLGPCTAYPAWDFDGTNDYIDLAVSGSITDFPDGDWTLAGWVKLDSLAGTETTLLATTVGGDEYLDWYIYQNSWARVGERGKLACDSEDDAGADAFGMQSSGNPFTGNTDWTHISLRRSSSVFTLWINGSQVGTDTNANFDAVTPTTAIRLGAHYALEAGRFLSGNLAGWAKWNRALSDAELAGLAAGFSPDCYPNGLTPGNGWLLPMMGGVYQELINGIAVTNNGTTSAPHPRMYSCN